MNGSEGELLLAVSRVVAAFDALGVEFLVGGSVASSVFGEPRQTLDADLIARLFGRHAIPASKRKAAALASGFQRSVRSIQPIMPG